MKKLFSFLSSFVLLTSLAFAQEPTWIFMGRGGSAYNFKTPLKIQQEEFQDINLQAKYATKPFEGPIYYDFHIVRWKEKSGWGLKVTHHKLYLQNNTPEIQRFTITDGYNLISITRQWEMAGFIYHLGGGVVMTHPESVIRGQHFKETQGLLGSGYHLSGPLAEAAIEKRINLSHRLMVSLEGRFTASHVKVPIAKGDARTYNLAIHGLAGLGYKIYGKKK